MQFLFKSLFKNWWKNCLFKDQVLSKKRDLSCVACVKREYGLDFCSLHLVYAKPLITALSSFPLFSYGTERNSACRSPFFVCFVPYVPRDPWFTQATYALADHDFCYSNHTHSQKLSICNYPIPNLHRYLVVQLFLGRRCVASQTCLWVTHESP